MKTIIRNIFNGCEYVSKKSKEEIQKLFEKPYWNYTESEKALVKKIRRRILPDDCISHNFIEIEEIEEGKQ